MRISPFLALLLLAVVSQACTPEETGLLTPKKTAGTDAGDASPAPSSTPTPQPTPTPTPTPAPVLQAIAVVPASFTLSSDPLANFDQRGTTLAVIATMSDARQFATSASWTATPTGRVTINAAGYVTVVPNAPAGQVTITASTGSLTAQAIATITTRPLTVSHVELSPTTLSLYKPAANGTSLPEYPSKAQLYPSVVMSDQSTTSAVTWSVSDPSIATVSVAGLVSALASGSCRIEAKSSSDPLKTAACELTVSAKGAVSVTLE